MRQLIFKKNDEILEKIDRLTELVSKFDKNHDVGISENSKKINEVMMQISGLNDEINDLNQNIIDLSNIVKNQNIIISENSSKINNLSDFIKNININSSNSELKKENISLKNEVNRQKSFIDSTPQLSQTALGRSTLDGKITYRNWWAGYTDEYNGVIEEFWFTQFIKNRFPNEEYKLNFFSVWNKHYTIKEKMEGKKIFYTSECIELRFPHIKELYGNYALDYVDLSLGYDYIDNPKYLRLPYWICMNVNPNHTEEQIEKIFESWNSLTPNNINKVIAINRHDKWNTRSIIAKDIEDYTKIVFAGAWNKNSNELFEKFNNNKIKCLKQYKFNLCAENDIYNGYVTEKIFDSIKCGCVPLYMGSGEHIEPKVINENAVLRWYRDKDNSDTIELFKNLLTDEKSYNEFKDQDIILDSGPKFVVKKVSQLEKKLENLITNQ